MQNISSQSLKYINHSRLLVKNMVYDCLLLHFFAEKHVKSDLIQTMMTRCKKNINIVNVHVTSP